MVTTTERTQLEKEAVKETVVHLVELLDHHIPVVGELMDLPMIDALERFMVFKAIDYVWEAAEKVPATYDDDTDVFLGFVCA